MTKSTPHPKKDPTTPSDIFWRFSPLLFASIAPVTGVLVIDYYLSGFPAHIEVMSQLGLELLALGWTIVSVVCLGMCFLSIFMTHRAWRIIPVICTIGTLLIAVLAALAIFTSKTGMGFWV